MNALLLSVILFFSFLSFSYADWEVRGNKLYRDGEAFPQLSGVSLSCTEFDSPIDQNKDGSLVCPHINNRTASSILKDLASKWKAQIIRLPVNSQWYLWDIDTGFPKGPSGCEFASNWAGKASPYGPYSPEGYRQWIDDHVTAITSLGMVVIIDLHWSDMEGTACCDNGKGGCYQGCQQTMADKKSLKFWEYVAKKYANKPNVWFEAYNEPAYWLESHQGGVTNIPLLMNGGLVTDIGYKNGCPQSPLTSIHFVGMQDIYNTIRDTAKADNIIVVGGADWAWSWNGVLAGPRKPKPGMEWCKNQLCQDGCGIDPGIDLMIEESPRGEGYPAPVSWSKRRWGKNVVYATHPYQQKGQQKPSPGQSCSSWIAGAINGTGQICSEQCGWQTAFGFLTEYVPVIATELGPWQGFACDGSYISCQLQWMKSKGISFTPWAYWGNFAAYCNTFPTLVNPDWTPNGYGQAVLDILTGK